MKIKDMIVVLISVFAWIIGFQLGVEEISFWFILLISFCVGILVFILLNFEEIFKKKEK